MEAAQGCLYLHSFLPKPIIHGDLKGVSHSRNLLIEANIIKKGKYPDRRQRQSCDCRLWIIKNNERKNEPRLER
jgi:hypothetical protein